MQIHEMINKVGGEAEGATSGEAGGKLRRGGLDGDCSKQDIGCRVARKQFCKGKRSDKVGAERGYSVPEAG
jgi:hypothetical protein